MIKLLLKHAIYEHAINVLFEHVQKNFTCNHMPTFASGIEGWLDIIDGIFYFETDDGDEYRYDKHSLAWHNIFNENDLFYDNNLYQEAKRLQVNDHLMDVQTEIRSFS